MRPLHKSEALAPQWNWTLNNMVLKTWFKVLENLEALAPLFVALAHGPCTSSCGPCTGPCPEKMLLFGRLSGSVQIALKRDLIKNHYLFPFGSNVPFFIVNQNSLTPNRPLIQLWCARSKLNMDEICSLNIHLWYVDIPQKVLLKSLHAH